ncbi:hypothetical protein [uncultured Clostridium sp.]|uniref:hypothetical protein n=1 Tax=uncultured Clostridium sp. TaxID=59620 RepID=UPI0025E1DAF2|nr:hypothetical protein [uncultured Clostridium sp.]
MEEENIVIKVDFFNFITVIFITVLTLTLFSNVYFNGGDKVFRILLTAIVVLIVRVLFKKTFLSKYTLAYISIVIFIFMSMYMGNILNIYSVINFYDKILHFISGIISGIIGFVVYEHFTKKYIDKLDLKFLIIFIFVFSVAIAGCWEIWEFSTDKIFGFHSQNNSLSDTMMDIICGTIGGIFSMIPIRLMLKKHKKDNIL